MRLNDSACLAQYNRVDNGHSRVLDLVFPNSHMTATRELPLTAPDAHHSPICAILHLWGSETASREATFRYNFSAAPFDLMNRYVYPRTGDVCGMDG